MNERTWEIYTLSDPRIGDVRYIGVKFRGKARYREHISRAVTGGKTYRDRWIRSLIAFGVRPICQVIDSGHGDGWQDAERHWIAVYRKTSKLVNLTDGGEGTPGYVPTPELRQKWSSMRTGVPYPQGRKGAMSGKKHAPEAIEKIRAASKGRRMPDSMKRKISELRKETPITEEQRERMNASRRKTQQTEEFRQKMRDSHPGKRIVCVETGQEFPSIREAARAMSVLKSSIKEALKPGHSCKGYHFKAL